MLADVIVRVIVTGIIAVVPSAKDPNLTRLIAPNHTNVPAHTGHAPPKKLADCQRNLAACRDEAPAHFAFVEVHTKNLIPGTRKEDFRYHNPADADGDDRAVFILTSELIEFGNAPSNTALVRGASAEEQKAATDYVLEMKKVCPKCQDRIDESYFDILANPEASSLRMDLRGGTERVHLIEKKKVWSVPGTAIEQPFAEELSYEFRVPACGQRLLLKRMVNGEVETDEIALHAPDQQPIDIVLGNAPVVSVIESLFAKFGDAHGDHFALFYDLYAPPPSVKPAPTLKSDPGDVSGPRIPCLIARMSAQDPTR